MSKASVKISALLLVLCIIFSIPAAAEDIVQVESIKISLPPEILIGETQKIQVFITPANADGYELDYLSSDNSVITAAVGTVIANKEGIADITVRARGTEISDTVTVNVVKSKKVQMTDIELEDDYIYMDKYDEEAISYNVLPSNAENTEVIFTSLDTTIATVNSAGVVYGRKAGTAKIKVQSADGSITKYVTVVVNDDDYYDNDYGYISVRRVDICDDEEEVTDTVKIMAGQSKTFIAIIYPESASDKRIRWKTEDSDIAEVDENGVVKGISEGTTKVYAIAKDNKRQDVITVEVAPYVRYPDSIAIVPQENGNFETGATIRFIPTFFPADTTEMDLHWFVNEDKATVDHNGNVTIIDKGIVTVKAYSKDWKQSVVYEFEAKYSDNHFIQTAESYNLKPDCAIIIDFDTDVSIHSAKYNIFAVSDTMGNQNLIEINTVVEGRRVMIIPLNGWSPGENYIFIKNEMSDIYGSKLGKNIKYKFNVRGVMR